MFYCSLEITPTKYFNDLIRTGNNNCALKVRDLIAHQRELHGNKLETRKNAKKETINEHVRYFHVRNIITNIDNVIADLNRISIRVLPLKVL